ncbi:MAG: class I SAM-dependent methyltransferase [Anaerolineae bacterium]|nr:class I SAM-dependent methyltransferase [Anaerolineae bacterium]
MRLPEHARILELGCGPGDLWAINRPRIPAGWELTLTDASPGMVEAAQRKLVDLKPAPTLKVVDAQSLPFDGAAAGVDAVGSDRVGFDAVVANHMLYHVPDRRRALAEIRRVLLPGGKLFATTVGGGAMTELWALVEAFIPDIHARTQAVASGFTLENGGDQLAEVFPSVARYDYEDALEVTEVQPIVAYLRSSSTLMHVTLEPSQWATIRRTISATIETKGAFHITKTSGLFIAS